MMDMKIQNWSSTAVNSVGLIIRQKDPNNLEMPFDQLGEFITGTVTRTEFGRAQFAIPSSGSGRGGGSPRPQRFVSEDAVNWTPLVGPRVAEFKV